MINMSEEDYLGKFYALLHDNLRREGNLRESSILLCFLKTQSASRYRLLRKSTLDSISIPTPVLTSLLTKGLIQCIENIDTYAITAKGVWYIEHASDLVDEESLLEYINDKYFIAKANSDLTEKEKVILFTMISARTFSEISSVDLKWVDSIKDKWKELLEKTYDKLHSMDLIIKLVKEDFLGQKGNVHVVSNIFRHNNQMVQKTMGIYSYNRKQEYYLDLYKDPTFSQEKLSYLFWKIFRGDISTESVDNIVDFCNDISSKESIYLFDMGKHLFSMPIYDVRVKDALMDSIISKNIWAKIT